MIKSAGSQINGFEIISSHTVYTAKSKNTVYTVKCLKCGAISDKRSGDVKSGKAKCKCVAKRQEHKQGRTHLYNVWCLMLRRTTKPHSQDYKYYGGRGITVCDEWSRDFMKFHDWAYSNGYVEGLTLDRIDVNGNYCPENCQWATRKTQANNTRTNHYLTLNGKTQSMKRWSEELGLSYHTLQWRVYHGWTDEEALTGKRKK